MIEQLHIDQLKSFLYFDGSQYIVETCFQYSGRMVMRQDHGTVLTKQQIDQNMLGGALSLTAFRDFKPKEKVNIRRLESFEIPVEYASYPIKDVIVEYSVELEDQIHQADDEKVIKTVSVMDKWRRAATKVKANKADGNNVNFLEKVLGQYYSK